MLRPCSVMQSQVVGQPTKVIQPTLDQCEEQQHSGFHSKGKLSFLLFFQISYNKIIIF